MPLPHFILHEPATLDEAAQLLHRHGPQCRVLAGGTDLLVDLKSGRAVTDYVISLNRIQGLRGVAVAPLASNAELLPAAGLRIGALTTLRDLATSPLLTGSYEALHDAANAMASPQIRNLATVGGNLAAAVPCADLPPVLIVLNAALELWSPDGSRTLALTEFFVGPRRTALRPGEILRSVMVPPAPRGFGAAYERHALREGNAIAVASVAASVLLNRNGTVDQARIALGAVAPIPKLAIQAGALLTGRRMENAILQEVSAAAIAAAEPITDIRGSAAYRRELVGILTRRALKRAHARAQEGQR